MTVGADRLRHQMIAALRSHLSGKRLEMPEAGRLLWRIFGALAAARTYHTVGPNPISYAEIDAYCRLHRWPLESQHVDLIHALDKEWLKQVEAGLPGRSSQAVSPAAFDAVFG